MAIICRWSMFNRRDPVAGGQAQDIEQHHLHANAAKKSISEFHPISGNIVSVIIVILR